MGRVFRKAFRILGLGESKGRWVMEQDFHGDLQVNLAWFFAVFSGILERTWIRTGGSGANGLNNSYFKIVILALIMIKVFIKFVCSLIVNLS